MSVKMGSPRSKCSLFAIIVALFFFGVNGYAADRYTSLIDSLNAEAQASYNFSFARARLLALAAKESSLRYGYVKGRVASTCLLSLVAVNTNDARAACDTLNSLLSHDHDLLSRQSLYSTLGICWYFRGDYDSARKYFESGMKLFPASTQSLDYATACLFAAKVYNKKGMATQALEFYYKAKGVLRSKPDRQTVAFSDEVIGDIYYRQRLYPKAIVSLRQSCGAFKSEGNINGMISSLLLLGNTYFMLMQDDSALACYESSLTNARILGDTMSMAVNYSNLSRILLEHKRPNEAIGYAEKALKLIKRGNYVGIEEGTYQQLGDIYGELKQFPKAIQYLQEALAAARASGNKTVARDCYKSLSELYTETKEFKPALDNLLAAYRIKDTIQSVAFSGQLADMAVKYETEKKETEIQLNRLKMLEQQDRIERKNLLLLALAALIVAIGIAIYFYIARRRQAEHFRRIEAVRLAEESERQRIAKDIHDELGSGLSRIAVLSDMVNQQVNENSRTSTAIHSISDTSRYLIDNMRDMVWNMNPDNTTLDSLVTRIREYSGDYLEDLPIDIERDIPEDVPSQKISMEVSRNVHMILKESLQNIVKHAQATSVRISIQLAPCFRMEIRDNGKGYAPDMRNGGNGIKNIIARSTSVGAKLNIYSEPGKGTTISLELDLAASQAAVSNTH